MKILITGIHGFVGTNLVADLCRDHEIYGLSSTSRAIHSVKEIYPWSALDSGTIPSVDAIIHLAGIAHDSDGTVSQSEYFEVNTALTARLYDYFLRSTASKFIFFSTVKAAADTLDGILTEDAIACPADPYGASKLDAENYLRSHPVTNGRQVYILRPTLIHGSGMKGNLPLLFNLISHVRLWPLGAYDNLRSFLSMGNLLFIVRNLVNRAIEPGTYNVCDDSLISTNRLIGIMGEVIGRKPRIWHLSPQAISLLAKAGNHLPLPLNSRRLKKLTESYMVSNAKIKKALGIESLPVSANDGLYDAITALAGAKMSTPPAQKLEFQIIKQSTPTTQISSL